MRKLIIIAVTLFMATNVFAQEVVEVIGVQWRPEGLGLYDSGKYDGSTVYFSNGQSLRYSVVVTVFGITMSVAVFPAGYAINCVFPALYKALSSTT